MRTTSYERAILVGGSKARSSGVEKFDCSLRSSAENSQRGTKTYAKSHQIPIGMRDPLAPPARFDLRPLGAKFGSLCGGGRMRSRSGGSWHMSSFPFGNS